VPSFDVEQELLSDEWTAGPQLIYDCFEGRWLCVRPLEAQRSEMIMNRERLMGVRRPAFVIGREFTDKKECIQQQRERIHHLHRPLGCSSI
jgi:hypothetical protein